MSHAVGLIVFDSTQKYIHNMFAQVLMFDFKNPAQWHICTYNYKTKTNCKHRMYTQHRNGFLYNKDP